FLLRQSGGFLTVEFQKPAAFVITSTSCSGVRWGILPDQDAMSPYIIFFMLIIIPPPPLSFTSLSSSSRPPAFPSQFCLPPVPPGPGLYAMLSLRRVAGRSRVQPQERSAVWVS
ncbi:unnamed protein product, partial [Prorocentrum cordatum]